MKLVLDNNQKYIERVDHLRFQDWKVEDIDNKGNVIINSVDNLAIVAPSKFNLYVQDSLFLSTPGEGKLMLRTQLMFESEYKDWISIPIDDLNREIKGQFVIIPFTVTPKLTKIIEGNHNASIVFSLIEITGEVEKELSSFVYPYSLKAFPAGNYYSPLAISITQPQREVVYAYFEVNGNNWEVIAPVGVAFETDGSKEEKKLTGSGYRKIKVCLVASEIQEGTLESVYSIAVNYRNAQYTLLLNAYLFEDYFPRTLVFNASSGLVDKTIQKVFFEEKGDFKLQYPYWLKVTTIPGTPRYLNVELPSADAFGTGQFLNAIKMVFANKTINIPVSLNSFDGFNLGIQNGEVVYAEATPMITFSTNKDSNYLEVDFILDDNNQNLFNFQYRIPFFQRKASFSIAEILRRQIILDNYYEKDFFKTQLPLLSLDIKEKNKGVTVKSYSKTAIPVLNGSKPLKTIEGNSILNNNYAERYTSQGVAVVNVVALAGNFTYSLRVNNEIIKTLNVPGSLRSVYLNFSKLGVSEGDVVEFLLHTTKGYLEKPFVIVPKTIHSNTIFYRNAHGLTSSIEFTGEVKIDIEKKRKKEKYSFNGEFKNRSYLEDSQEKLMINTGYIFADQITAVNDLLNSDQAFFYQKDERFMLVPNTEKITKLNTEEFLNQFYLEFLINDIDYAQVHF